LPILLRFSSPVILPPIFLTKHSLETVSQVFVHGIRWRIDTRDLTNYPCRAAFTLQPSVYLRSVCSEPTKGTMWITVALPCRTCYQNWMYNLRVLTSWYSPPRLSVWLVENIRIHYWL
jgi:hypothetical protein